jgi:hypothetical protein
MVLKMYWFATNDLINCLGSVNWVMEIQYWLKRRLGCELQPSTWCQGPHISCCVTCQGRQSLWEGRCLSKSWACCCYTNNLENELFLLSVPFQHYAITQLQQIMRLPQPSSILLLVNRNKLGSWWTTQDQLFCSVVL